MSALLEIEDLRVVYEGGVHALRGVDVSLDKGESLAVVGESGSGKSTFALCMAGLLQPPEVTGSVRFAGQELMGGPEEVLRSLRWERVALCLQNAPFNPVSTVGVQVAEPLRERRGLSRGDALARAEELAEAMYLEPALLSRYPHQLSGGERRRAYLAMALVLDPDLVVLDEPTAGLDPATRHELVERIAALATERGFALVVISHDLPDATRLADRTMVLYAGEAMEVGTTDRVIEAPAHPYSWALVNTFPVMSTTKDLRPIRGHGPDPRAVPPGCPFHTRCTQVEPQCWQEHADLRESRGRQVACHFGGLKTLLQATDVHKTFGDAKHGVAALAGVSFTLQEGESVGVIGPSGSGKSTMARIITGHLALDRGRVELEGESVTASWRKDARRLRRKIQLVMQDPWDALSPRLPVEELVAEPLLFGEDDPGTKGRRVLVEEALESVGLPISPDFLDARTHELSGGQLQRVALARALVIKPKVLVADEPTALLDASEQARLLVCLRERQTEMGMGLVLISHDLAVIRKVTDRILILDHGEAVEEGPSNVVSTRPTSPTGKALMESAPSFSLGAGERRQLPALDQRGS
ncbi:MAG TPA: ABC transporter ATP-binding protein [Egibacteraceae bacterium]|nr:ABC transporter ATP-binding protein [Egibacteraceae bacterium]